MSIPDTSKGIALDTCVIRSMMENPNYTDMVFQRIDLRGASVDVCKTVALEARGQDVALDMAVAKLEARGAVVVHGDITARMRADAEAMLELHAPLLHRPDNYILAYAKALALVLLTRDRGLEAAAEREGVGVINPDKLCGTDRRPRSGFESTAAAYSRLLPRGRGGVPHGPAAAHSRRPPADHVAAASRKRRRRNLPRRASPLRA